MYPRAFRPHSNGRAQLDADHLPIAGPSSFPGCLEDGVHKRRRTEPRRLANDALDCGTVLSTVSCHIVRSQRTADKRPAQTSDRPVLSSTLLFPVDAPRASSPTAARLARQRLQVIARLRTTTSADRTIT